MARQEGWPALFWTAFKGSRNPMVLLDDHRRNVDVNGAYLKLAGYTRDEVIGRPVWEFVVGGPRATERQWERAITRGELSGETVIHFVNRASDLVYAMARFADVDDPALFEGRGKG